MRGTSDVRPKKVFIKKSMATIEYFMRSQLERGVRPMKESNIDGTGMAALLKSRAHTHLRERLHTAKSSDFVVFEATDNNLMLRRCMGPELRRKLLHVVLPLANERQSCLEPQAILNQHFPPTYAPIYDNLVPYLVSFFLTPLKAEELPKTLTVESAKLLNFGPQSSDQLVCVLQPNIQERPDSMLATDAIMSVLSQQIPVRHICGGCEMVVDGRLKCSACRRAVYCSKACQKAHWSNGHKHECGSG